MPDKKDILYDKDSDVLYISTLPGRYGIARESLPGVIWRYQDGSGDIVGVTIMDFSTYWKPRLSELADDLVAHLHISLRKAKSLLQVSP